MARLALVENALAFFGIACRKGEQVGSGHGLSR
jgi:hypothetical protein